MRLSSFALAIPAVLALGAPAIRRAPAPDYPGPKLHLIEESRLDAKRHKLFQPIRVAIGPAKQMLIVPSYNPDARGQYGRTARMYDSTGKLSWLLDLSYRGEIGEVSAIGWHGTTTWIADAAFNQVAIIDAKGTMTQSIEPPSWIKPPWADRANYPVFGRIEILAYLPDESMIGIPRRAHMVGATPGYDENKTYIVRVDENGTIEKTLASFKQIRQQDIRYGGAFQPVPRYRVAPDGSRLVILSIDSSATTHDVITVVALGAKGDTIYSRAITAPRSTPAVVADVPVPNAPRGSARGRVVAAAVAAGVRPGTITGLILGPDNTVWLTLRETATATPIVGIDPSGKVIGTVLAPVKYSVRAGDQSHLWCTDQRAAMPDLVRYTFSKS